MINQYTQLVSKGKDYLGYFEIRSNPRTGGTKKIRVGKRLEAEVQATLVKGQKGFRTIYGKQLEIPLGTDRPNNRADLE